MASAENQTYSWTCPDCEYENIGTRRTDVACENCGHEYDRAPGTSSTAIESPVRIDLNGPFTEEDVQKLIASVEDDHAWTLVITYAGQAFLLDFHANRERFGLADEPDVIYSSGIQPERFMKEWHDDIQRDERLLAEKTDDVYLRFESFGIGNGYVGPEAAQDERHIRRIYGDLKRHWEEKPKGVGFVGDI
jgi:hypothetical protein